MSGIISTWISSEIRFNAYRFQSRLDKPADLYAAFAKHFPRPELHGGFVSLNPHQSHVVGSRAV